MHRNFSLDFLKVILSLFVIATHVFTSLKVNDSKNFIFFLIHGFARLAVPLFFIISGYFLSEKINDINYIKKVIVKFFKLFFVWQLVYFTIEYDYYQLGIITWQRMLLDSIYGIGHLWYLMAFMQGIIFLYLLRGISPKRQLILSFFLFILGYIFQLIIEKKIYFGLDSIFTNLYAWIGTSRNAAFYGLPYLLIGMNYQIYKRYLVRYKYCTLVILIALLIVEIYCNMLFYDTIQNIFLVPMPLSVIIFDLVINSKNNVKMIIPVNLSLGIYLVHFYVLFIVFKKNPPHDVLSYYINYFIILIFSIMSWFILDKINDKIKIIF